MKNYESIGPGSPMGILTLPSAERRDALEEYKEALQKKISTIATVADRAFELMQTPNLTVDELTARYGEICEQEGLDPEDRIKADEIFGLFIERAAAINDLRQLSPEEIYAEMFGIDPVEPIHAQCFGESIVFYATPNDADTVYTYSFQGGKRSKKTSSRDLRYTGFLTYHAPIRPLQGALAFVINGKRGYHSSTVTHERRHALQSIVTPVSPRPSLYFMPEVDAASSEALQGYLEEALRYVMPHFLSLAKDEIIAHLTEQPNDPMRYDEVLNTLLTYEGYDYIGDYAESLGVEKLEDYFEVPESLEGTKQKLVQRELYDTYKELVGRAVMLVKYLVIEKEMSADAVLALLELVPLEQWEKVAKRYVGDEPDLEERKREPGEDVLSEYDYWVVLAGSYLTTSEMRELGMDSMRDEPLNHPSLDIKGFEKFWALNDVEFVPTTIEAAIKKALDKPIRDRL